MSNRLPIIKLFPAFTWLCPHCRRRNYIKSEVITFTKEEIQEIIEDNADDDEAKLIKEAAVNGEISIDDLEFYSCPDEVVCKECMKKYGVSEDEKESDTE